MNAGKKDEDDKVEVKLKGKIRKGKKERRAV